MKFTRFLWVLVLASGLADATNIDGTITYQAQIKQNGTPANGTFDFQFRLFDTGTPGTGNPVGIIVPLNDVVLTNGQLSADLNFGTSDLYTGTQLFLEVGIRPGNSQNNDPYTLLNPRQRLTEVPFSSYADHADIAAHADVASATDPNAVTGASILDGSIKSVDVDATQIQRRSATMATACAGTNQSIKTIAQDGTVTCETDDIGTAGGGITSITAGTGLSGGTITTSGTIAIAAGGVGATQVNSAQVQLRVQACAAGSAVQTVNQDGSVACVSTGGGGGGWALTGNPATATDFLGTTNGLPLVMKTSNTRVAQLQFVTGSLSSLASGTGANILHGHAGNSITTGVVSGTISGGGVQQTSPAGPGVFNVVTDTAGTVGGGYGNQAGDNAGTTFDQLAATVGGGRQNIASAGDSTVAGGTQNLASASSSTVAGGGSNIASGVYSTVPGGFFNTAGGGYSFAGGFRAKVAAADEGTFVWSDRSTNSDFTSSGLNQFKVRAAGGVIFASNPSGTTGVTLASGAGAWTMLSDRNMKHGLVAVDAESVLERVVGLPLSTWTYNSQSDDVRHMGPMAQDFYAAFAVGETERGISTVDASGVALAAIQGLNAKLERENSDLRAKNAELESRLTRIEQTLLGTERNAGR